MELNLTLNAYKNSLYGRTLIKEQHINIDPPKILPQVLKPQSAHGKKHSRLRVKYLCTAINGGYNRKRIDRKIKN